MVVIGVSQMIYDPIAFCVINQGCFFLQTRFECRWQQWGCHDEQQVKTSREQSQRFSEEMRIE